MNATEMLRIQCATLGFMAVLLKNEPMGCPSTRAAKIADLLELYCYQTLPDILGDMPEKGDAQEVVNAIDVFKNRLSHQGDARLPSDRKTLLKFYDCLHQRQNWRKERAFYLTASDDVIADRVLELIDEELNDSNMHPAA